MRDIERDLQQLADGEEYRAFTAKLLPTADRHMVIGVRMPVLRDYAGRLVRGQPELVEAFMADLPHRWHEENLLHAILIGLTAGSSPHRAFALLDAFLPHVTNWAVTDAIRVPAFARSEHRAAVLAKIRQWAGAVHEYTVRYAVVVLLTYFLDDGFAPDQLDLVAGIERDDYYVNMARAWYVATALTKQWEATIDLIEHEPARLDRWTHNKSIQKARESYRISPEHKAYLATLRR